ncbi:MAG: helix-turn-helix transcriptional regulator [Planctomycetales bacterium]|nr:helix-turn-helix transcriptional regulator [Planctomycetales bacterium]
MRKSTFSVEYTVFRETLKDLRLRAEVTQTDLATRIGHPQSHVSKFEAGERRLDVVETMAICNAIGVSFEDFVSEFTSRLRDKQKSRSTRSRRGVGK